MLPPAASADWRCDQERATCHLRPARLLNLYCIPATDHAAALDCRVDTDADLVVFGRRAQDALAAFPSALSTRAYARSPSRPRSVTSIALSSSPSIDLTGYRHSEATEPCVALGMSSSSTYRAQYAPHTAATPDLPVRLTSHGTQQSKAGFVTWHRRRRARHGAPGRRPPAHAVRRARLAGHVLHDRHGAVDDDRDSLTVGPTPRPAVQGAVRAALRGSRQGV